MFLSPANRSSNVMQIGPPDEETTESRRRRLRGNIIIKTGWSIFALSMILPVHSGQDYVPGFMAVLACYLSLCCTGVEVARSLVELEISRSPYEIVGMLAASLGAVINSAILLLPLIAHRHRPLVQWICAGIMMLCTAMVIILPVMFAFEIGWSRTGSPYGDMGIGYFTWALSCCVICIGTLIRCQFRGLEH